MRKTDEYRLGFNLYQILLDTLGFNEKRKKEVNLALKLIGKDREKRRLVNSLVRKLYKRIKGDNKLTLYLRMPESNSLWRGLTMLIVVDLLLNYGFEISNPKFRFIDLNEMGVDELLEEDIDVLVILNDENRNLSEWFKYSDIKKIIEIKVKN